MTTFAVADRVRTSLAYDVTDVATTIAVAAGTGDQFPTIPSGGYVPVFIETEFGTWEKVHVTSRTGDNLGVLRNQGGTNQEWSAGSRVFIGLGVTEINAIRTGADITSAEDWVVSVGGTPSITVAGATGDVTITNLAVDVLSVPDGGSSSARIAIGNGDDLEIYHTGDHSHIRGSVGNLYIATGGTGELRLQSGAGDVDAIKISNAQLVTCSKGLTVNTTAASSALTVADGTGVVQISTSTTIGAAALRIDQNDTDQPFIRYDGSLSAGSGTNISSWTSGNSIQGFVKVTIEGVGAQWMPYYNAPTS